MQAIALRPGDTLVDVSPTEYEALSNKERKKLRVHKVESPRSGQTNPAICRAQPGHVHVRVSGGHWCIHESAEVTLIEAPQAAETTTEKAA